MKTPQIKFKNQEQTHLNCDTESRILTQTTLVMGKRSRPFTIPAFKLLG